MLANILSIYMWYQFVYMNVYAQNVFVIIARENLAFEIF